MAHPQKKRQRGSIKQLSNGSYRVRVYAGVDSVTGKERYLTKVVHKARDAEEERTRLLNQVDERRHPKTNATLNELLDKWLAVADLAPTTRKRYIEAMNKHVRPFMGRQPAGHIGPETLEHLYAELRRCRDHCVSSYQKGSTRLVSPRKENVPNKHICKPLSSSTIRKIHFCLSGAFERGVRWRWIVSNPTRQTDTPQEMPPNPNPPSATEAAQILNRAMEIEPAWGTFLWLSMMTGARRGEMCALRWKHFDLTKGFVKVQFSITQLNSDGLIEGPTKTHQKRQIALDDETIQLILEHRTRYEEMCRKLDIDLDQDSFMFSNEPDGSLPWKPASITLRYQRLVKSLGISTHLHALRHYSATELISAGVDLRTVAGRLGHGGGGATTLRVYAAWLPETDRQAASTLRSRVNEAMK